MKLEGHKRYVKFRSIDMIPLDSWDDEAEAIINSAEPGVRLIDTEYSEPGKGPYLGLCILSNKL